MDFGPLANLLLILLEKGHRILLDLIMFWSFLIDTLTKDIGLETAELETCMKERDIILEIHCRPIWKIMLFASRQDNYSILHNI